MLIAHLSDPHLRPPGVLYHGLVDSNAMFTGALAHLAALRPRPDAVVISGDIVDTGDPAEYAHARTLLAQVEAPLVVIPGNHDEQQAFRAGLGDVGAVPMPASGPLHVDADDLGPVRILGLDVTVPGAHHGEVTPEAAAWLASALSAQPDRPTVVVVHQPPFALGVPYIDTYWCCQGQRLGDVLAQHPQVERLLCGHVHRAVTTRFSTTLACTAPSTTTAIALGLAPGAPAVSFVEPPTMLLHHWTPQGQMLTHHLPIGTFPGPLPFA